MFKLENIQHQYHQKNILNLKAWEAIQGEACLLLGNSGSGKTTLLHIMAGLLKPTQGRVTLAEVEVSALSQKQMDRFRAKNLGLIFQKPHLIPTLNVKQNLLTAQYMAGFGQNKRRIEEALSQLNVSQVMAKFPSQLSGGEAQRVSVARAVLHHPKIILADEPTASLDDQNALQVIDLLQQQALQYKATLVIATHDNRVKSHFEKFIILENQNT
jgi:putative ABC transport system ATP-binding protein